MAKAIIDLSGIGGLAPRFHANRSSSGSDQNQKVIGGANQYAIGIVNPIAKYGHISPANGTFTTVTTDPATVIGSTAIDIINSKVYLWERGTKMHVLDGFGDVSLTNNRTVSGATGTDLEIYQINGVRKLFYSYRHASGGNIGIFDLSSTYDDTWLSATVAGAFTLGTTNNTRLIPADNSFLYVLDGAAVHRIDGTTGGGTNGTVYSNVLTFPAFFQLIDAVDVRGKMWILLQQSTTDLDSGVSNAGVHSTEAGVYVWDRQSGVVNSTDFIPFHGVRDVRAIVNFRGLPWSFTVSSAGYAQLRSYNGNEFKVIKELGPNDYPRYHDSVAVQGDLLVWHSNGGGIFAYGKIDPSAEDGLYKIGDSSTITGFSYGGAVAFVGTLVSGSGTQNFSPEALYLSIKGTTSFVKKWYLHAYAPEFTSQNPAAGDFYTLVKPLPKLSKVQSITLFYPPVSISGANTNMTADIYFNQSTTSWGSTIFTADDAARGWKYIQIGKSAVNSIQLKLVWSTSIGLGDAITPLYAEIEYEPTEQVK